MRRDSPSRKPKRQAFAATTPGSIGNDDPAIWIDRAAWNQGINARYAGEISDLPAVPPLVVGVPHAVLAEVEPYVKSRRAQSSTDDEILVVGFSHTQGLSPQASEDAWPTLRSGGGGHAVAYDSIVFDDDRRVGPRIFDETIGTLQAFMGTGGNNTPMVAQHIEPSMAVRRLTPLECERLMGWPDDHTRYNSDGSEQADTHRYKQCGNGVASPVARWIAQHLLNIPRNPA